MKYRQLGNTGLTVSEIGFGAWGIGGVVEGSASYGQTSDKNSIETIQKAFELGVNFFDTAPAYGNGKSESLLGDALRGQRKDVIFASKVGINRFTDKADYSKSGIRKSVESSLVRLKTDHLDLLQLHSPDLDTVNIDEVLTVLDQLRSEGLVNHLGASIKSPQQLSALLEKSLFQVFQVNLNALDQRLLDPALLKNINKHNAGIIARTPLCFGFLTDEMLGDTHFPVEDHRSLWSSEQRKLWLKGRDMIKSEVSVVEQEPVEMTAVRFCLSFNEISTVIPGMMAVNHVLNNLGASDKGALSAKHIHYLTSLYESNRFFV